jgi:hypothetical protein
VRRRSVVPSGVVVKLEQWDGEELHILGNGEDFFSANGHWGFPEGKEPTHFVLASALGTISCTLWASLYGLG